MPQKSRAYSVSVGYVDGDGCLGDIEEGMACSKKCARQMLAEFKRPQVQVHLGSLGTAQSSEDVASQSSEPSRDVSGQAPAKE